MGTILDPGKVIFGHFIDFGHFPIEIPIEAEKFYGQQKEGSYIKNKNCVENRRPNGTIRNHVEIKIPNFVKIRITLPSGSPRPAPMWDTEGVSLIILASNVRQYFHKKYCYSIMFFVGTRRYKSLEVKVL